MTKVVDLIMQLEGKRLAAAEPYTEQKIVRDLRPDKTYTVTITEKRSLSQNNLYWAGLAWAVDHCLDGDLARQYPTAEHLHDGLLIFLGYYREVPFIMLRNEPITDRMRTAGLAKFMQLMRGRLAAGEIAKIPDRVIAEVYEAMRREGPHYGVNIVPDSTRFSKMSGDVFTGYFDRAKITLMQWINRDPWEEWLTWVKEEEAAGRRHRKGWR